MWWSQDLNSAVLKYVRSVCLLCWHIIPQCPHHVQPQKQKHCKTHTIEPGIWHLSWALAWGYLESTHLILTLKVPWPRLVCFWKISGLLSLKFIYLKVRIRERQRGIFHMLIHFPRADPGARSFIGVSPMCSRDSNSWTIFCCFSQATSRELDWKWGSWDINLDP